MHTQNIALNPLKFFKITLNHSSYQIIVRDECVENFDYVCAL